MSQPEKKFPASLLPRFHFTMFDLLCWDASYSTAILREPVYSAKFNRWVKLKSQEILNLGLLFIPSISFAFTPPCRPVFDPVIN